MGKPKAALNVTFTLKSRGVTQVKAGRKTKMEEFYEYVGENGATVKFHAHPTRAWVYVIMATNDLGRQAVNQLIEAFTIAGIDRRETPFYDAVATLKV